MSMIKKPGWEITRQKGKWHYIFIRWMLGWGGTMYILNLCFFTNIHHHNVFYIVWTAALWLGLGAIGGIILWYLSEKRYQKKIASQQ
jgi:drug/metabolite transporter (DMT)-like permease